MQLTQVAYGGCWKRRHAWHRCSASVPCLAASQNGFVHSFGTGIGRVTWLQSLMVSSPDLDELLQAPQSGRVGLVLVAVAPVGERDLADVDVAARVDGEAV